MNQLADVDWENWQAKDPATLVFVIQDGKIKNYQCVVPSTWNAGPRNQDDKLGPYEASLVGNPIADAERLLEILRTINSFDPCLACAVHIIDAKGKDLGRYKINSICSI